MLTNTLVYSSLSDYTNAAEYGSVVMLIFPFWSLFTGFCGVTHVFSVEKAKALWWFIILPGLFYAMGFIMLVIAALTGQQAA